MMMELNYDDDGNFDNDGKNYQKTYKFRDFSVKICHFSENLLLGEKNVCAFP